MSTTTVLPPGVPLPLYEALPKSTIYFDGEGQVGNWADVQNWWGGRLPTATSTVVVPVNATLNGSFTAENVMFLGDETVTVNGVLTTLNPQLCESFMVCDDAVAMFSAGSALHDAGALIVGNDDNGTLIAGSSGSAFATLTSGSALIGRLDGGIGLVTIDGAHWTNTVNMFVGLDGQGTLNIENGGVVQVGTELHLGCNTGAAGQINLSGSSTLTVGTGINLGSGSNGIDGSGTATLTIGAESLLTSGAGVNIFDGSEMIISGGSFLAGPYAQALRVQAGGTLFGHGTLTDTSGGIGDLGTITASGGTLILNGALTGNGLLQIAADSTADLTGATLGKVGVTFTGTDGTLDLAHALADSGTITDFAAGDTIIMPGVTGLSWNAATNVLSLTDLGQVVDKLHFVGSYTSNSFVLSQSGGSAMIGFNPTH